MTVSRRSESQRHHSVSLKTLQAAAVLQGVSERAPLDRQEAEASMLPLESNSCKLCNGSTVGEMKTRQKEVGRLLQSRDEIDEEAFAPAEESPAAEVVMPEIPDFLEVGE